MSDMLKKKILPCFEKILDHVSNKSCCWWRVRAILVLLLALPWLLPWMKLMEKPCPYFIKGIVITTLLPVLLFPVIKCFFDYIFDESIEKMINKGDINRCIYVNDFRCSSSNILTCVNSKNSEDECYFRNEIKSIEWIAPIIGILERALITTLVAFNVSGAFSFAGAWIVAKAMYSWGRSKNDNTYIRAKISLNVINGLLSIIAAVIGGLIIFKHENPQLNSNLAFFFFSIH